MLSEDTKLQILNQHYESTFSRVQEHIKVRDIFFVLIMLGVSLMLFQMASPKEAGEAMAQFLMRKLAIKQAVDVSFITSIVWFVVLASTIRYYQAAVHLERQYKYIQSLEDLLSPYYERKAFTREGKSYLSEYPLFSSWVGFLYTIVSPALLVTVATLKIYGEVSWPPTTTLCVNVVIWFCMVVSTVLYLIMLHYRK